MSTALTDTREANAVEALSGQITALVQERQELRGDVAAVSELEHNRRQIARLQQLLSEALIQRYLPSAA